MFFGETCLISDKISLFVVGGTYIRCAANNKQESANFTMG